MSVWAGDFSFSFSFSLSLSLSLSLVARTFWHTKIFKRFIFGLLRPFCHFEPLQKGDPTGCKAQASAKKSTQIKRKLAIFGYFACAQYDKFGLLSKNDRQRKRTLSFGNDRQKPQFRTPKAFFHSNFRDKIYKFYSFLWIATLALLARNDGGFCHFEPFAKRRKIQRIESTFAILRYFANAQYDKFRLLLKNNGYFHSNFKAKIQIFHSKFKAFCKFNSFHKFISNFKPYTRLFYIFTPNFRSVFTDKFCTRS